MKQYFVDKQSVVRQIWGKSDTVLFIFAGAAAEFALNRAVDWLYFTGRLPSDPLGRLFSTVSYSKKILFAEYEDAVRIIDTITSIHSGVENKRGQQIPEWAFRDVLFMLIHYSIASFEVLERSLSPEEKQEVYDVFYRFGTRMHIQELPANYDTWLPSRQFHLEHDLASSELSRDLFRQYKKHLGLFRYSVLLEGQIIVVPDRVRKLLGLRKFSFLTLLLPFYKLSRILRMDGIIKSLILPAKYKAEIKAMDIS